MGPGAQDLADFPDFAKQQVTSQFLPKVDIIGTLLCPRFGDLDCNCVRMERLDSAKSPNLGAERCPVIPTLLKRLKLQIR